MSKDKPQLRIAGLETKGLPSDLLPLKPPRMPYAELELRLDALARTVAECPIEHLGVMRSTLETALRQATGIVQTNTDPMIDTPIPHGYMAATAAARLMSISERTIRRWITDGDIQTIRRRGRVFVDYRQVAKLREFKPHEVAG